MKSNKLKFTQSLKIHRLGKKIEHIILVRFSDRSRWYPLVFISDLSYSIYKIEGKDDSIKMLSIDFIDLSSRLNVLYLLVLLLRLFACFDIFFIS